MYQTQELFADHLELQLDTVDYIKARYGAPAEVEVDVFQDARQQRAGIIDVLARLDGLPLIFEVKTEIRDIGSTVQQIKRYRASNLSVGVKDYGNIVLPDQDRLHDALLFLVTRPGLLFPAQRKFLLNTSIKLVELHPGGVPVPPPRRDLLGLPATCPT